MTEAQVRERLDLAWSGRSPKMDWLGMEHVIRDILYLWGHAKEIDAALALSLIDDAVAAFTKRGSSFK